MNRETKRMMKYRTALYWYLRTTATNANYYANLTGQFVGALKNGR